MSMVFNVDINFVLFSFLPNTIRFVLLAENWKPDFCDMIVVCFLRFAVIFRENYSDIIF